MLKNRQSKTGNTILQMNILPERYQRRKIRPGAFLAVILILVQLLLLYPISSILTREQSIFIERKTAFQELQAEVDAYNTPQERIAELETELDAANQQLLSFEDAYSTLNFQNTPWSAYLDLVQEQTPAALEVESILFQDSTILIVGRSESYQLPLVMVDNLQAQEHFSEVRALSIQLIPPEEDSQNPDLPAENPENLTLDDPQYSFELAAIPDPGKVTNHE